MAENKIATETTSQKDAESLAQSGDGEDTHVQGETQLDSLFELCSPARAVMKEISVKVSEAEALYSKNKYQESLDFYIRACDTLLNFLRSGAVQAREKQTVQVIVSKLISRAEKIKLLCPRAINEYDILQSEMLRSDSQISFDNVGGCGELKCFLTEHVCNPCKFPERARKELRSTILLYGHPGTGKSMLLDATAREAGIKLFVFNLFCLGSKYYGGQEFAHLCIKTVFRIAENNRPCILCLEDIHVLNSEEEYYRRAKTEILIHLHKIAGNQHESDPVIVFGVTQKPWLLDRPFLKCFQSRKLVGMPSLDNRMEILRHLLTNLSHNLTREDIMKVAHRTEGFTGADLSIIVSEALMEPVRTLCTAQYFKKICVPVEETSNKESVADGQASTSTREDDGKYSGKKTEDRKEGPDGSMYVPVASRRKGSQDIANSEDTVDAAKEPPLEESGDSVTAAPSTCAVAGRKNSTKMERLVTTENSNVASSQTNKDDVTEKSTSFDLGDSNKTKDKAMDEGTGYREREENILKIRENDNTVHGQSEAAVVEFVQSEAKDGPSVHQQECPSIKRGWVEKFIPCEAEEEGAVKATFPDFPEDKLYFYPQLPSQAMMSSLDRCRASVPQEEQDLMRDFVEGL